MMQFKHFRTFFSVLITCTFVYAQVIGQEGTIHEDLTLKSSAMGKEVNYSVYLPPGYEHSNRRYPVVYLLHGYTDDDSGWIQFGEAPTIVDELIRDRTIPPMILVMPDGGVSWYINNYDGSMNYDDFMVKELIPHIDFSYRTRPTKEFRALAGLSMGGYGSFMMALKHPELFSAAAPLSAAVFVDEEMTKMDQKRWDNVFGILFGKDLAGTDRLNAIYRANSVLDLINKQTKENLEKVRYYIDCGDDDFLIKGNMDVHTVLLDKEVKHEFRVRDGGHTWSYWRSGLPGALSFIGESFHR